MSSSRNKVTTFFGKIHREKYKPPLCCHKETQCNIVIENIQAKLLLLNQLPHYNGEDNQIIDIFIKCFKLKVKLFNLLEKDEIELLLNCIDGKAAETLAKHLPLQTKSWNGTSKILTDIFSTPSVTFVNIETLRKLKQSDETLEQYSEKVKHMVDFIFSGFTESLKEKENIRYFVRGVKPNIKKQLKGKRFKSFKMVLTAANNIIENGTTTPESKIQVEAADSMHDPGQKRV